MAGENTYKESDGKAVNVSLLYAVEKDQVVYADGWLGIAGSNGESGDEIALSVDNYEYQLTVPAALEVAKGQIVYIEVADVTGHVPDDSAYTTSAGAGKVAFMKATAAKDANNVVTGIMLASASLAS